MIKADMVQPPENNDPRIDLSRRMVGELPKFGHWATSFRDFETPFGKVGFRQLSILWALRYELSPDDVSTSWFAHHFDVQPSVMTRSLAKLERAGFIVRERDPHDGRRIHIAITDTGRQVSEFVEHLYTREVVTSIESLTDAQIDELGRNVKLLGEIADTLEEQRVRRRGRLDAEVPR